MTRFAMYETGKKQLTRDGKPLPFFQKVLLAGISGAIGGLVGTPADLINVRYRTELYCNWFSFVAFHTKFAVIFWPSIMPLGGCDCFNIKNTLIFCAIFSGEFIALNKHPS